MKKLNNKGMTIIEVLVCFVLVAIITTSMYNSISNFNDRRNLESMKEKIINVKNLFTKQVEDDIVKKGLVYASAPQDLSGTKIITATGGVCPGYEPMDIAKAMLRIVNNTPKLNKEEAEKYDAVNVAKAYDEELERRILNG